MEGGIKDRDLWDCSEFLFDESDALQLYAIMKGGKNGPTLDSGFDPRSDDGRLRILVSTVDDAVPHNGNFRFVG